MKKWMMVLLLVLLASFLVACGGGETAVESERDSEIDVSQTSEPDASEFENLSPISSEPSIDMEESTEENDETNILVAYFSYAENTDLPDDVDASATASVQVWNDETTGNTGVVAAMIAEATGRICFLFDGRAVSRTPMMQRLTVDRKNAIPAPDRNWPPM